MRIAHGFATPAPPRRHQREREHAEEARRPHVLDALILAATLAALPLGAATQWLVMTQALPSRTRLGTDTATFELKGAWSCVAGKAKAGTRTTRCRKGDGGTFEFAVPCSAEPSEPVEKSLSDDSGVRIVDIVAVGCEAGTPEQNPQEIPARVLERETGFEPATLSLGS